MSAGWLSGLTSEQRRRVDGILASLRHTPGSHVSGMWIRCSPTSGPPAEVVLVKKDSFGRVVREWWIEPWDEAAA